MTERLGKYRLVRRLGAGGMGEVWEAVDTVLDRSVAVKLLTAAAADNADVVREAAAAARVLHPNVVALYDAAEAEGRWFLVMEYVAGKSAAKRVNELVRLPWPEATRIARDAAAGLAAVHAAGFIHRDVKPGNILIAADGTAKVADFGLARKTVRSGATTMTGVAGTPEYMSPEQCWSEAADGRTDVYSLGATYFTLLTGRAPFIAATDVAVMYAHCNAEVPNPRDVVPELPAACATVIRRAMAKQPADRHPTADALRAELDEVLAGEVLPTLVLPSPPQLPPPTVARLSPVRRALTRRAWLAALPVSAVAVGAAAYLWPKPDPREERPNSAGESDAKPPGGLRPPGEPWPMGKAIHDVAVSPNGRLVAVSYLTPDGAADAIDLRTWDGQSLPGWPERGRGSTPEGISFSADGLYLAGAYRGSGMVRVWRVADGQEITVEGESGVLYASRVAFTADGEWLVAGGFDSERAKVSVRQWNGKQWRRKHAYQAKETSVWGFALEPKGFRLALATGEGHDDSSRASFELRDVRTGEPTDGPAVNAVRHGIGPTVAFAPAGDRLAFSAGGRTTVYTIPGWAPQPQAFPKTVGEVWALAFTPDGGILAAADITKIHLWRTATGELLTTFDSSNGRVYCLAVTPDGRTLLSGNEWTGEQNPALIRFHDLTPFLR